MITTSRRTLILLSALVWYGGVIALGWKTIDLVQQVMGMNPNPLWPGLAVLGGLLLGGIKGKYLFSIACIKNLNRIAALESPKIWQFYRPRFFLFLCCTISLSRLLTSLAQGSYPFLLFLIVLDLSIAMALGASSLIYWRHKPSSPSQPCYS